ncbi:hypothetical protein B0T17DRAFT_617704 [Bombardia bombarda]|uniref:Zn(2)-C6 fungal-type domain-containing protein n=1 Tax=Bombardia bombarda TaxID=252184 RepID=A0AA40C0V4_9PEZI|nr:hypothetical protein B0T17DRAFT_617704 [Bombardia bombarda]
MAAASAEDWSIETTTHEPLACVNCRSRKLKCDRRTPVCSRCAKSDAGCLYPESRKKPPFKRRNVRELEARLVQVEGLLKNVVKAPPATQGPKSHSTSSGPQEPPPKPLENEAVDFDIGASLSSGPDSASNLLQPPIQSPRDQDGSIPSELIGLGQFEGLPPSSMIEELHDLFFETQRSFLYIIHKGNYLRSFYSTAPHMRPPMCLQYAIWTTAACRSDKYRTNKDVFYRRTRQYLEADELKGFGEHYVTVSHAQAWALVAIYEAHSMFFTGVAMSSARCVRLVQILGLHRLDDPLAEELGVETWRPILAPPRDRTELEERRRTFWCVFCIDSHASITTGWPSLIDISEVTAQLPISEDAFNGGKQEKSYTLQDALKGHSEYSVFGSAVVTSYIFNQLLKHVHRPMPNDRPEDPELGMFWKRHRELDNMLSNTFMSLPECFRLTKQTNDPIVAHTTQLNLHASVISLHNLASDKAMRFNLPSHILHASKIRSATAAREIVNIMKMTRPNKMVGYKSPLVAFSLYSAAAVYIHLIKESPESYAIESLEFLIKCMETIGRQHPITRIYLGQVLFDTERNGVSVTVELPPLKDYSQLLSHNIPLLTLATISRYSNQPPPLPEDGPSMSQKHLDAESTSGHMRTTSTYLPSAVARTIAEDAVDSAAAHGSKRKRAMPVVSSLSTSSSVQGRRRHGSLAHRTATSPSPSRVAMNEVSFSGVTATLAAASTGADINTSSSSSSSSNDNHDDDDIDLLNHHPPVSVMPEMDIFQELSGMDEWQQQQDMPDVAGILGSSSNEDNNNINNIGNSGNSSGDLNFDAMTGSATDPWYFLMDSGGHSGAGIDNGL